MTTDTTKNDRIMMKKGLIALLLALTMVLPSCLNTSDSEPDPMAPGISIYRVAYTKNQLAMVPADAAVRLAMLLAEAEAQGERWSDVEVDGKSVKQVLFSNDATITEEGTKYTIEFQKSGWYYYYGNVEVETNGTSWSDDDFDWTITTSGLKADVNNGWTTVVYEYSDEGTTRLYNGPSDLTISLSNMKLMSSYDNMLLEGWTGLFNVEGFGTYSDCHGKELKLNGEARDSSLSWKVENVHYKGVENQYTGQFVGQILSGKVTCAFVTPNYDKTEYPSSYVTINFSNNGQSYTIRYNGLESTR